MSDDPKLERARRVLLGASALAAAVRVEITDAHPDEIDRVAILGIPVFKRDAQNGRPRLFGVPFPRWLRGPRRP